MDDIDGKTTVDMGEIDTIDNSRRLRRLQHDYNSKQLIRWIRFVPKWDFSFLTNSWSSFTLYSEQGWQSESLSDVLPSFPLDSQNDEREFLFVNRIVLFVILPTSVLPQS